MATKRRLIKHLPLMLAGLALGLGVFVSVDGFRSNIDVKESEAYYSPNTHYSVSDTASKLASYYSTISDSDSGTTLLTKLQNLNSTKRKKTVGYSTMGTDTGGAYIYTDYDLNNTATDNNGQTYGTKVASFYTKTSATSWNREHVWPNSHGGDNVEDDILHTRPTISSENSSRGNSFYVEGLNNSSNGWDPYTAGYDIACRGECARIILYSVVAYSGFSLSDANYHATTNANPDNMMGNMNTLIKWHFDYSPNVYEMNRNNGAEYLQGNRNPFVDHPEYVARIWSNFNSTVSNLCTNNASMYSNWTPGSYSSYGTNNIVDTTGVTISKSSVSLTIGNTTTISATSSDSSTITWTTSSSSVASISSESSASGADITITANATGTATITAKATINNTQYTKTCAVTVSEAGASSGTKTIYVSDVPSAYSGTSFTSDGISYTCSNINNTSSDNNIQWKSGSGYLYNTTAIPNISSILINSGTEGSFTGTIYTGSNAVSSDSGTSYSVTTGTEVSISNSPSYFRIKAGTVSGGAKSGNIVITYGGNQKTLSSISVKTAPTKTSYTAGQYFDPTGLVITRKYSDNSTDQYAYAGHTSEFTFSPSTSTALTTSNTSVTITYGGKSCTQSISVAAAVTLTSISVNIAPTKTTYFAGQYFDPTGLVIRRNYSNNTNDTYTYASHTSDFTFSPTTTTALKTSNTFVTITYGGKSTTQAITVNPVVLSSISTSNQTTEYAVGDTFSYDGTCTATYNNASTKIVTPTVNLSNVNMNTEGAYTVTLSYTEGGVTKTTSYSITVTSSPFVNTIEQLYSREAGTLSGNTFYGLYMGYTTHIASNTTYYDLFVGNGKYAMLVYGCLTSAPSYTSYETGLSISGGYLKIYNNLYEVVNYNSGSYPVSINQLTSAQISEYVAPISIYTITGNELGTNAADQKTASRAATVSGTVASVSGTIGGNADVTVVLTLSNNNTANIFVKKGLPNLDYTNLAAKLVKDATVTVRGFTSIYNANYQLINPEIVEASATYGYADFAQDLLDLTSSICSSSGDKETSLSGVWTRLEVEKYAVLSDDAKATLISIVANESGNVTAQAMARYDLICKKYASCRNFIGRSSANRSNALSFISLTQSETPIFLVVFIISSTILVAGYGVYTYRKRREL